MNDNYYLAKWLNNEISDEELKKFVSEEELRAYKKIISATEALESPDFDAEKALNTIQQLKSSQKVKKLHFIKYVYRVAAVFALLFSSYYFISNKSTNYTTNLAEKTSFELPDNSKVNLNADSEITFKSKKWHKKRELNLQGEAFFDVTKGSTFTVNTNLGMVSVLGTQFNVVVRNSYFEVNCYEGLVSVNYQNKSYKVPAGNSFKVLNSTAELNENLIEKKPAWLLNNSSFKSMPYSYVIKELERQYNISVDYDEALSNNLFTGNFTHTNLELALKAVSIPLNLTYTIINDKKVSLHP